MTPNILNFCLEDGCSLFLWNIGSHVQDNYNAIISKTIILFPPPVETSRLVYFVFDSRIFEHSVNIFQAFRAVRFWQWPRLGGWNARQCVRDLLCPSSKRTGYTMTLCTLNHNRLLYTQQVFSVSTSFRKSIWGYGPFLRCRFTFSA
jgi:hypothetical protein